MGSTPSPDLQQTPNLSVTPGCTNPNSYAITIDTNIDSYIAEVDKLELESYTRRARELERALRKQQGVNGAQLTEREIADLERRVDATELARRVALRTITNTAGAAEPAPLSSLPHSYRQIRNLLWIEHHPVYRTALAEWRRQVSLFASRVERKIKRTFNLKNEIYNMLGFYSVFQGVLLTATSQSNYLHCRNVGLPIALSSFASLCTLVHICRKFEVISGLEKTIVDEQISLKEAKSRIDALKNRDEAFRFSDFLEDKEKSGCLQPKFHLCGLRSRLLVPLAIFLFSMKTKFINGTSSVITLKEANSGIQRFLFKLGKRDDHSRSSFEMELDTNATYREYHLFVIPSSSTRSVIVSSDHLLDYKVITITEVEPGVFAWEGTPRKEAVQKPEDSSKGQAASAKLTWWLSRLISP